MTTAARPRPWLGFAGVALGVAAGITQLLVGSAIPQWSGNKTDTAGLGVTTVVLSLVAGVGLAQLRRELPRWERIAALLLVLACTAVCFTTVGRLWYVPGAVLILAALLTVAGGPSASPVPPATNPEAPAAHPAPTRVGVGGWLLYAVAVVVGLGLTISSLVTLLLGSYASSVAVAAAVALVAGLAVCAAAAPALRRRTPALLAGGFGAGLMAGGLVLGSSALMIAMG